MSGADDKAPGVARMMGRALLRRCPRCGTGHLFMRWFRMVARCPGCAYHFERRAEDGFFLGAYVLNLAVTESALAVMLFGFILVRSSTDSTAALWPVLVAAGAVAVLLPLAFYPFSKTLWAALVLAVRPLPAVTLC